ncbi:MAG: N-acetylmuramoyl-L-alanine amidase [Gemmatimonadaceae bacterium]|nr:N-acetylmuramoyl-L-alanine amidase [Gemmatimonadaceae bacterium]
MLGPLDPKIVYPAPDHLIESRDSNFVFGSVGNGHATLTINGIPVPVLPNGSFLAFLPNPTPDQPQYDLVAALGADTVRLSRPVRLLPPRPALLPTGPLVVDSASVTPAGRLALRDEERVRVSVRAPANATVVWRGDSTTIAPLVSQGALPGPHPGDTVIRGPVSTRYVGEPERWATSLPAARLRAPTELVISRGADTVRLPLPAIAPAPPPGTWGVLGADSSAVSDTDRVIIGRPVPNGTYKWLLIPGTVVPVTGWAGDFARVRLDDALEIWVLRDDVRLLPAGWAPAASRVAGNASLIPARDWVDLVIPMASCPPFLVEEGEHSLTLTLYGVHGNTDILHYLPSDSLVRVVRWTPVGSERVRYTIELTTRPYGYLALWDRGRFVLRVRRPPRVDRKHPLAGRTIAIDPGHPPIGATGPTGLYEPVPTLAVAERVRALLEAEGATVVMTRTTPAPVALGDRPIIARRANADALVSIHLNALPDGVNPFGAHGTGTYFFHPQSAPLARAIQDGLVRRMGLRDLGVNYDNLALARPTWMPAVLCEGAFIMIPEQEAALRTPTFQDAYARGIVEGLEHYFRALATPP